MPEERHASHNGNAPIQCRLHNPDGWQCPPDALQNEEYRSFHLPT